MYINAPAPTESDIRAIAASRAALAQLLSYYNWEAHYLDAHIIRSAATPTSAKVIIHTPSADGVAFPKYWVFWLINSATGSAVPLSGNTLEQAEQAYHTCTLSATINA